MKLAQAETDIAYGLLACWQVGKLKDAGGLASEMISLIKRQNCDRALVNTRVLQEVFGGNAVSDEYHIGRIGHNLHVVQTVLAPSSRCCWLTWVSSMKDSRIFMR
jgi:glutaryl-CoA dehydrogenase